MVNIFSGTKSRTNKNITWKNLKLNAEWMNPTLKNGKEKKQKLSWSLDMKNLALKIEPYKHFYEDWTGIHLIFARKHTLNEK